MFKLIVFLFSLLATFSDISLAQDWQAVAAINTARSHFAAGVIGDKIYIFGGQNADNTSINSIEVFDLTQPSTWTLLPGANNANINLVKEFAGTVLADQWYVFGGYDGVPRSIRSNYVESYDPVSNIWSEKSSMPTNRFQAATVTYNQQIYAFGGEYAQSENSPSYYYKIVEAYDPLTDSWRFVANMPQLRLLPALAVINDKAYVIGGGQVAAWKTYDNLYAYDFINNRWIKSGLSKLPTPRVFSFGHAAPVLNGKIYLVGGATAGKKPNLIPSTKVEIYDPISNTWQTGPSLPQGALYNVAVAAGNEVYVIAGQTTNSEGSMINNVWKLPDVWKSNLSVLETCDLNADGKSNSLDASLFNKSC